MTNYEKLCKIAIEFDTGLHVEYSYNDNLISISLDDCYIVKPFGTDRVVMGKAATFRTAVDNCIKMIIANPIITYCPRTMYEEKIDVSEILVGE